MSTGDAILGLAGLYLLWQQNQIFRQQNEIFAAQAGASKMPSDNAVKLWLRRYWPILAMVPLVSLMWAPIGYDYYGRYFDGRSVNAKESALAPWLLLAGLLLISGHAIYVRLTGRSARVEIAPKLRIHSAVYGTGPMNDVDVLEITQKRGTDGLVVSVDNNTLGCDPAPGLSKRLEVHYSYSTSAVWTVSRP